MLCHKALGLGHGELPEVKNTRGEHRIRTAFLNTID
jgi:hypothetical protein